MQHRIHGRILQPDQTIAVAAQVESAQQAQAHLAPAADEVIEERGLAKVQLQVDRGRHVDAGVRLQVHRMGLRKRRAEDVGRDGVGRHAIPPE